jgi:TfoX/Sxy family transcriptional regulator of competence genes
MGYDEGLAERIRVHLAGESGLEDKRMFGGVAFLLDGNMAVAISGGDLMVRVGRDAVDEAVEQPHVSPCEMGGRPMKDWVLVAPAATESDEGLREWLGRGAAFARSLPAKG